MHTLLFYFTGTGNSLHISRSIAARLGDVSILPLVSLLSPAAAHVFTEKTVGFVFPTHFYTLPDLVKKAIELCEFEKDTYFFAAATSGGDAGNALADLDAVLRAKNSRLHYGIEIPLGDNSLALQTPALEIQNRLANSDDLLNQLTRAVIARDTDSVFRRSTGATLKQNGVRFAMRHYYRFEDRKIDRAACSHCGLCQRICPVNNIQIEKGEVRFGEHCALCFACINYCPRQAIRFGRLHPRKETQYRFPGVTAEDIMEQKMFPE